MHEWNETQRMMRDMVRQFVEREIKPNLEPLEHGDMPPYDILRKMLKSFGMDAMAKAQFDKQIAREEAAAQGGESADGAPAEKKKKSGGGNPMQQEAAAMAVIPIIELCRYCPGMVTAMGVSMGLTAQAIMSKGTIEQKKRWGLDLLTMKTIGSWAITEPDSGSDAFGSMKATARRDGDGYILNGNKTFITNGPYADTIVFICKLDEGNPPEERRVVTFVLDKGMPGLEQSKPMRKMGIHSSPTGELFLTDVKVGQDRLLGGNRETSRAEAKAGAKATFTMERTGVAAMALGIIQQCLDLSVNYARERQSFGKPIGEYQLIQLKLANMEVARLNVQNLVFRHIELMQAGKQLSLAEASAMKLYSARTAVEVAMEAVQLFGGNGYMAEFQVEQLARDAKILQIYGGTDEMQIQAIAKDLLRGA